MSNSFQSFPSSKPKTASSSKWGSSNPFARALAETEKNPNQSQPQTKPENSLFSSALANSGNSLGQDRGVNWEKQQQELAEQQQKKEVQRQKLHRDINPVDMVDVFSHREKQVKEEINKLREELKMLSKEVTEFHKEIDLTLNTRIIHPGDQGKYYLNFFHQLRTWIMLLRQRIHSARTWANQMNTKSKKKRSKFMSGIDIGANKGHEQTKSVFDTMHHEQNNAYGAG